MLSAHTPRHIFLWRESVHEGVREEEMKGEGREGEREREKEEGGGRREEER